MITLNEFTYYLGITYPDPMPEELKSLLRQCILASVEEMNKFTNRYLAILNPDTLQMLTESRTEYYDGNGNTDLYLNTYPVILIEDDSEVIKYLKDDNTGWENLIIPPDTISNTVVIMENGRIKLLKNYTFPKGIKNIMITYEAGYTSVTLPAELKIICYEKSAEKFWNSNYDLKSRLGISRKVAGENEWTYKQKEHDKILLNYRRKVI